MSDREAMKLALTALKDSANWCRLYYGSKWVGDAIHALETALAAPDETEALRRDVERLRAELRYIADSSPRQSGFADWG